MTAETLTEFQCPGEKHTISRSLHIARLAACYPACRECSHRHDTGGTTRGVVELLQATERRVERESLFTDEGVRGIYLNELTRGVASDMAAAFAALLWERPGWLKSNEESPQPDQPCDPAAGVSLALDPRQATAKRSTGARRLGPTVVVGHDERPAALDLVTGVASALRRMGCHVIDVGLATRPMLWFTIDHLRADGGVHVTGSGCDPAWSGLDFVGASAQPMSRGHGLNEIEMRFRRGVARPGRHPGSQRMFLAAVPYVAGLWKHFHALRPLRISLGCASLPLRRVLDQLFDKLACRRVPLEIPMRARDVTNIDDADCRRVAESVRSNGSDFGVLIDDDGQRCSWFDEQGNPIASRRLAAVLAANELEQRPGRGLVDESAAGGVLAAVSIEMRTTSALVAGGDSGRVWFADPYPNCDAVLTLAKVLQALSRSDAPFSSVVATVELASAIRT
jgi:phosphomannomutase